MPESSPSAYDRLTLLDYWEILRLPVLFALIAIAATWAVWYFTSASCSPELVKSTGCNLSSFAQYINLEALNKMATHAAIAGGGGGIWSYAMITRERKAREAAEKQLAEERAQAAEEREMSAQQLAEEREKAAQQLAEERAQAAEEREKAAQQLAEEREKAAQQLAEERERDAQQLAEERAQAAEERRQLHSHIEQLTQRLNGGNGAGYQ